MIIGDPYQFAVFYEIVKEWNVDDCFNNGILYLYVDGISFPQKTITATLKIEIPELRDNLSNLVVDSELYNMEKEHAFITMYNLLNPQNDDEDNDYRFEISTVSLSDNNCFIFAVSDGRNVRIMADKLEYIKEESRHNLKKLNIKEIYISQENIDEIISKLYL